MTAEGKAVLDAMDLGGLCRYFDAECRAAQARGKWLYEVDPEFARYAIVRMRELAVAACSGLGGSS